MKVDFDKQIDTILRDLAKGNIFAETLPKSHLDADELSAFAENALPVKARLRATEHLADCPRCRKILTNTISLNFEAESETIHEEVQTVATIPPIPWYRQFFAFPQLAYVMGALVLTFSGMVGYLVLQNTQNSEPTVARQMEKTSERPAGPTGASSEGQTIETYSSNSANTASSANTAANVPMPAANVSANSSAPASPPSDNLSDKSSEPLPQPTPALAETVPVTEGPGTAGKAAESSDSKNKDVAKEETVNKKSDDAPSAKVENERKNSDLDNNIARQQQEVVVQNRNQSNIMTPDGVGQNRNMPPSTTTTKSSPRRDEEDSQKGGETRAEREKAKKQMSEKRSEPTMTIGSKTFRNLNGIWTDSVYQGGSTINIKRGSKDYKKLDSGLQNIGNSFSETVIVVWGSKNYKIQ